MSSRPRAVFDCNILLQAAAFRDGPAGLCLRLVEQGSVALFVSKATLAELTRVFSYEEVQEFAPHLTPRDIESFFRRLEYRATRARTVRHLIEDPRDPTDEKYLDLAVAVDADYLVTRDKDLLSLRTSHSVVAKQIRQRTHPLKILTPVSFLREIEDRD
jgi:uncharacterized protein